MSDAHIDLDALFKRLHLATMRRIHNALEERAAAESWTHREFLMRLLTEEVANRAGTRVKRLSHQAKFPYLKTIEEFDFTFQASLRRQQLGPFLGPEFVTEGRNLILSGAPGRGKTHIAIALAYKAIQNGFEARFVTATALIDELAGAAATGKLREVTATYVQPHVLVIDEVGYLQHANSARAPVGHGTRSPENGLERLVGCRGVVRVGAAGRLLRTAGRGGLCRPPERPRGAVA